MEIFKGKIETKCIIVEQLGATYGIFENISVTNIGISGNVEFLNGVTFHEPLNIDCIDVNKLNANTITSNDVIINDLSVTGQTNFYDTVTFHGTVIGISGISNGGSGGDTINGVSGFLLDEQGDVYIQGDLIVSGEINTEINTIIGQPTNDNNYRPIDISSTSFTDNIGINLNENMKISDGFQIIDQFFKTYFLCPPPGVTLIECISTAEDLTIEWENFKKVEYAALNIYLPHVIENRIDYVKSSLNTNLDWSDPSTITINTTSRDTNKVIFHTQGSTSTLSGNTWNEYTIESSVPYDIRIYGINHHSGEPIYLQILNKSTTSIGIPSAPTLLNTFDIGTTSISSSWTKPIDHDDSTTGNNIFPIIERYLIDYEAIGSVRYPTFLTDNGLEYTTLTTYPTNSSTNKTINGLNPGTEYKLSVSAKNAINSTGGINNDGYSPKTDIVTITTELPEKPNLLKTTNANELNDLTILINPYPSDGGYSLDGQTICNPIIRFANINDEIHPLRTIITPNIRNNEIPGTTYASTSRLYAYGGLDSQYQNDDIISIDIDGYSYISNVGNYDSTKIRLRIDTDGDYYNNSPNNGFYKSFTMYAQGITSITNYPASIDKYVLGLRYENLDGSTGSDITTEKVNFYIDDLNNVPDLSGVYITEEVIGISASTQISGIPTYKNNAEFKFQFTASNLANNFLRNDRKHAEVLLETSENVLLSNTLIIKKINNDISSGNVDGSIHQYYEAPLNLHEQSLNLHNTTGQILAPNSGNIQLHTFTIELTDSADNKFDEDFRIQVTGYNLFGSGTSVNGVYVDTSNSILTTSKLRIDTRSIENERSNSSTTSSLGRHVKSGLSQYPDIGTTQAGQCGGNYDHSQSILSGDYADELQLVNGYYSTPLVGDGYKNYNQSTPNNYYFPTSYTFYDYSSISSSSSNIRYTTFKYTGVIPTGTTKERLRITINGMNGLTVDFTQFNQANHEMWLRVLDIGDGTSYEDDTTTSGWLDCTNTIGQSGILTGINGTRCINGGTSTATQRDCFIRPGTTENAEIYIRLGLPQNINAKFISITCEAVDTFISNENTQGVLISPNNINLPLEGNWRINTKINSFGYEELIFERFNGTEWQIRSKLD